MEEALSLGNYAYVVKSKIEHDLLATVDAVLREKQVTVAIHTASGYDAAAD